MRKRQIKDPKKLYYYHQHFLLINQLDAFPNNKHSSDGDISLRNTMQWFLQKSKIKGLLENSSNTSFNKLS